MFGIQRIKSMMLNIGMFFTTISALFLCLWLTRKNVILEKRNNYLCNKLLQVNIELKGLGVVLESNNDTISSKLQNLEEDYVESLEEDYSRMAEELACKREEEADRIKEEALLSHIEEDCDQCCQDGSEVCSVKNDHIAHGKIKNQFGNTIHIS